VKALRITVDITDTTEGLDQEDFNGIVDQLVEVLDNPYGILAGSEHAVVNGEWVEV